MVELALLKEVLRIPSSDTSEDAYLEQCEAAAVVYVEARTGLHLGPPEETTVVLDGPRYGSMWLDQEPIIGDPTPTFTLEVRRGDSWAVVPPEDYELDGNRLYAPGGWQEGVRNYRATYTRGFSPGTEPDDLRQVVIWLAVHCFTERTPVVTGAITAQMPIHLREFLRNYGRGVKL